MEGERLVTDRGGRHGGHPGRGDGADLVVVEVVVAPGLAALQAQTEVGGREPGG